MTTKLSWTLAGFVNPFLFFLSSFSCCWHKRLCSSYWYSKMSCTAASDPLRDKLIKSTSSRVNIKWHIIFKSEFGSHTLRAFGSQVSICPSNQLQFCILSSVCHYCFTHYFQFKYLCLCPHRLCICIWQYTVFVVNLQQPGQFYFAFTSTIWFIMTRIQRICSCNFKYF